MSNYEGLRYWYLHELRRLRAAHKINGAATKTERKATQRKLVEIRKGRK